MKTLPIAFILGLLTIFACKVDNTLTRSLQPNLPSQPLDYMSVTDGLADFKLPEQIPNGLGTSINLNSCCIDFNIDPFINQIPASSNTSITSDEQATLGRVLFYDARLSKNNSISCASCHKQEFAFSDNVALSDGFGGKKTLRNAMGIINPMVNNSFFWDSREASLKSLTLQPVLNHIEMGIENRSDLESKLAEEGFYKDLFQEAYGDSRITSDRISDAMAQFVASTFKADARFDKAKASNFENFTEMERIGMGVFFNPNNKCATCHTGPNFMAQDGAGGEYMQTIGTANNGLLILNNDHGKEKGQFKIPSLRNIALTGPYMHDGRFDTLREVLEFYNTDVSPHPDLDDKLQEGGIPKKLGLTKIELDALEAFLNTLTSESITTDEKLSDPFKS